MQNAGVAGWVVVGLLILPGCGPRNEKAAPLRTGVFAPQEGTIATDPMSPVDRSGPLASEDAVEGGAHRRPASSANGGSDRLSAVVQENMEAPGARAATMTGGGHDRARFSRPFVGTVHDHRGLAGGGEQHADLCG
jgi:hypothetical protein